MSEEQYLREQLALLHREYLKAAQPYIDRLARVVVRRPPSQWVFEKVDAMTLPPLPEPFMLPLEMPMFTTAQMREYAAAAVAAEREACARMCEGMSGPIETYNHAYTHYLLCAASIRARGEQA